MKTQIPKYLAIASTFTLFLAACGGSQQQAGAPGAPGAAQPPAGYPVFTVSAQNATLNTDYPATIQGVQNIEIRPKVDGYVEAIYVDEGSVVKKGQLLFKLNAPQYRQDVNNAAAAINSAEADVNSARLQVNKTKPLVEKDIISHYELETDVFTLNTKIAALAQARTTLANAKTNLGYTTITSPVNGVIGSIPYKIGSLVTGTTTNPLTTVSNIGKVYAYFSLNEKQLLEFSRTVKGNTIKQKIANTPAVSLILSDGSAYSEQGRIETIAGLIDTETGSASFRAAFPNPVGLLRSGGSATVRIPQQVKDGILIPQRSAYELQGKHFVYVVDKTDVVKSVEVKIMELAAGQYYVVTGGLKVGDRVVYDGNISLKDAAKIKPEAMAADKVYEDLK
ncbi:efflux RND transporter periplasmic adaptor subunit [Mucilaginibacter phyllosphaerae]|uniref:Efflux RND transporter periplasmic adaptor subunit n=1 Tax=Mucilaginibacter phyllosphaerae TaxID=1812349 RepID=A0A4Y8AFW6_9SPHI|nr:efflux RND transporter periplasmic adaptor subunit [Mucilaginibacter phyllosphaerae]MBB3968714.1 membrane fusion protein (multidrug efflux system) [Mucilaginibacter phyllosphaerae]TEW67650.1 efflux RND transporter periplasmic adaptor subunit [Mucilaginibacter phyllosphaerae]GGH14333.1 hemolysin D [Mucilaginibacter phyllosphaerae]